MLESDSRNIIIHPLQPKMEEENGNAIHHHHNSETDYKSYDDDGRLKRTGTVLTTSSHIITAVIGSGVLSLTWAIAQLGWVFGLFVMIFFAIVTWYTSDILAECYRSNDPLFGKRNYTFTESVHNILGVNHGRICGVIQYFYLYCSTIGYTIAPAVSMKDIKMVDCIHSSGGNHECSNISINPFLVAFGVIQIFVSQIPNFSETWWLSIVAAIMSFTYSIIGLGLAITKVVENGSIKGSLTGVSIGTVSQSQKAWNVFQALGNIAFAYSFSQILIEIQDTVKNPPSEVKTMKKATKLSIGVTTAFYMLCGCVGYAGFGDEAPGNLLTGFDYIKPYWLINLANATLVIHIIGAYQVYVQPVFAIVEKVSAKRWPKSKLEYKIPIIGFRLSPFRLVWRTIFVIITTVFALLIPFFNDVLGFLGAVGFWPLSVYFPIEMYILQRMIPKWSSRWIGMQILSIVCLVVTVVAAIGSVTSIVIDLKTFKPFVFDK